MKTTRDDEPATDTPGGGTADRRTFLRRAGVTAAGAATLGWAAGCSGKSPTTAFDSVIDHPARESGVDTVVIVMMENRSFDHFAGWLATDEAFLDAGRRRYGPRFRIDGRQQLRYRGPEGREYTTRRLTDPGIEPDPWRGCDHPIPGHGWGTGRAQMLNGFIGADTGNDEYALGYFTGDDVPFTRELARRFTTFDHWHASLLAGTFPNRQYLHAATSNGRREDPIPLRVGMYPGPTIWDRLAAARVPARYYHVDLPVLHLWGNQYADRISPIDDFFDDAHRGRLPNVVMVDPGFRGPFRSDDHTYADIRIGQRFIREVFGAFTRSTHWERGAFVLLYDEWGGFFDHVRPPVVPDDRRTPALDTNFGQTGFRVPAIVASPRARRGAVDHTRHEHTSVLRFLEWRFLGAPGRGPGGDSRWYLTQRDRHASNLGAALTTDRPDPELGFDIHAQLVGGGAPCVAEPGTPTQPSAEWALDEHLQALTRPAYPDVNAPPWIFP